VRLPLRPSWAWLDWELAISSLGHDFEVKQTYAALIRSDRSLSLFLDVGANYGMHSALFLSAGIPVIAFEPNRQCRDYFERVCKLNGLSGRWEEVAVGDRFGEVELVYPEHETWLGSVNLDVAANLRKGSNVLLDQVPLRKLDDYLDQMHRGEILIKIDVEGFECEVIRGASRLLRERAPKVIFESNKVETRAEIIELWRERKYEVFPLPYKPSTALHPLSTIQFLSSRMTNFIATPCGG
jgi:FkbM family methyltransferase